MKMKALLRNHWSSGPFGYYQAS